MGPCPLDWKHGERGFRGLAPMSLEAGARGEGRTAGPGKARHLRGLGSEPPRARDPHPRDGKTRPWAGVRITR